MPEAPIPMQGTRRRRAAVPRKLRAIRQRTRRSGAITDLEHEVRTIGCAIKYWRQLRGLTQETLAGRVGISQELLSRYERGEIQGISYKRLGQIARELDTTIKELTEGEHPSPDTLSTAARRKTV
jgi:ribosome-binding protein aMBF1 (putative translation factor)